MKKFFLWASVCFLAASGCTADPYAKCDLGPSRAVVSGCINAIGGLDRWRSVGPIKATALVTVYDEVGKAMVNEQRQTIDLGKDVIQASARTAQGRWTAEVAGDGESEFQTSGFALSGKRRSRLVEALRIILHRVRGPMNLCGCDERPLQPEHVRVDGKELIRVPVEGGAAGVKAYYFDAQTCTLRMVTAGADAPGGDGTVTVYSYRMMPNGMAFPVRISVMKIGQHVLIGTESVLKVEYRKVNF